MGRSFTKRTRTGPIVVRKLLGGRASPAALAPPTLKTGLEETLALTPALSPRRGGSTHSFPQFLRSLVWNCFMGPHVGCYEASRAFREWNRTPGDSRQFVKSMSKIIHSWFSDHSRF